MTDKDIDIDMRPLSDEEAQEAAGGGFWQQLILTKDEKKRIKAQAADGRLFVLPSANFFCNHNNDYKFAREKVENTDKEFTLYQDVKCYYCGKRAESWKCSYGGGYGIG